MRLSKQSISAIRQVVQEEAGTGAEVRVFGSRLDETRRGGDVDLLVKLSRPVDNPAWLVACIEARTSRALEGRRVDVLLEAPNLARFPIHEIAEREGVQL